MACRPILYSPIARFGVGFWSVFTIAQSATIQTASFEPYKGNPARSAEAPGIAFEISLGELREYTVFRPARLPCGTTARLRLHDDAIIDDLFVSAQRLILCSEVPVSLWMDGEETIVPDSVPDVPDEVVVGNRTKAIKEADIQLFRWRGTRGMTELSLCLAYRIDNNQPTFLADEHRSIMTVLPRFMIQRSAICGFSVPIRLKHLSFDLNRVGAYFANRTTPEGIAFSLDRQNLIENVAAEVFAEEITDLIHEGYRAFLDQTNGHTLERVAALRSQAAMHGGNVYDVFTGDELHEAAKRFADLSPIKLYPVNEDKPIYIEAAAVQEQPGSVCFLPRASHDEAQAEPTALLLTRTMRSISQGEEPLCVMETDRSASWLFDNDPDSTVSFPFSDANQPLLVARPDRIDLSKPPESLAKVQGRWTGDLYLREFEAPDGKPYVFLGRHRILIKRRSRLGDHLAALARGGRFAKISDFVAELAEDDLGHRSLTVAPFLA
ncbi:hypothetical protein D3C71_753510 [compost metagenome]